MKGSLNKKVHTRYADKSEMYIDDWTGGQLFFQKKSFEDTTQFSPRMVPSGGGGTGGIRSPKTYSNRSAAGATRGAWGRGK